MYTYNILFGLAALFCYIHAIINVVLFATVKISSKCMTEQSVVQLADESIRGPKHDHMTVILGYIRRELGAFSPWQLKAFLRSGGITPSAALALELAVVEDATRARARVCPHDLAT